MCEWIERELQNITTLIKDGSHGTHKDVPDGIPLLSAKDINEGMLTISDDCRKISMNDYALIHNNYEIENDDLLITIVGTIGRIAIVKGLNKKITFQRSVCIIRLDKKVVIPDYLFYVLQSSEFQLALERSINASAQGGVYLGTLGKLKVKYPNLIYEQQRIARILTTCEAVIEKSQSAIAKYKATKQGMLHDLFTRGIDLQTGKLRPCYEDAPELYKPARLSGGESKLGWIPKEWDVINMENFASDEKNAIVDGPFGSNLKTIHYRSSGVPVIQSGFVTSNVFKADSYMYVNKEKFESEIRSKAIPGDIIIAKIGAQCGTCAILPENHPVSILAGNSMKITVAKQNSVKFLEALLQYLYSIGGLADIILATAQPAVSMASFKVMPIIYPKPKEQFEIAKRIEKIKNILRTEQIYLQKMQLLKKGLMEDLLSGRKRLDH